MALAPCRLDPPTIGQPDPHACVLAQAKEDIVQQVHLLCNASSASQDNGAARDVRLLHDAPRTPAARGGTLIAEALDVSQGAIEWVKSEGSEGLKDRRAAVGGGARA